MLRAKSCWVIVFLLFSAGCATSNQHPQTSQTPNLKFESGSSDIIDDGNQAAVHGDWKTAVAAWKEAENSEDLLDQVAAAYNLGLYDETKGNYSAALVRFEKAKELSDNAKFDVDIARVREQMKQPEKPAPAFEPAAAPAAAGQATSESAPAATDDLAAWKAAPGLKIVREKGIHRFNWEPVPGAAGYHVYTAKAKGKPFKQLNHNILANPQLRAKALPRGKVLVQVAAFAQDGRELARSQPVPLSMP
jgi:tetratricopeptide (TPR) repeat protein